MRTRVRNGFLCQSFLQMWLTVFFSLPAAPFLTALVQAATPASPQSSRATLTDLPLPAQATISAVLGRDDPAYHAVAHREGLQLINPRHNLTVDLTPAGVQILRGGAQWGLTWQGYGYGIVSSEGGE